jgi:hypothetical protein
VKATVLLVDRDLGFVFWLGRLLDKLGYEAYPAKSVRDAFELISKLHLTSISLLVVNRSMPEAAFLIKWLRGVNKSLRVILTGDSDGPWIPWEADAQCSKSTRHDEKAEQEWHQLINSVFLQSATHN